MQFSVSCSVGNKIFGESIEIRAYSISSGMRLASYPDSRLVERYEATLVFVVATHALLPICVLTCLHNSSLCLPIRFDAISYGSGKIRLKDFYNARCKNLCVVPSLLTCVQSSFTTFSLAVCRGVTACREVHLYIHNIIN